MFLQAHNDAHLGMDKTIANMKKRLWYPCMEKLVRSWIRSCPVCLEKRPVDTHDAEYVNREAQEAGERLYVDLAGPMTPVSLEGYRYVLVALDSFSRYVTLKPLKTKEAKEVALCLMNEIFLVSGVPKELYSDLGREFTAREINRMFKDLNVNIKHSLPYFHQSNNAERTIRTLISLLRLAAVTDGKEPAEWPTRLPAIAFAINTAVCASTGVTPFQAFIGREPRVPMDMLVPPPDRQETPGNHHPMPAS